MVSKPKKPKYVPTIAPKKGESRFIATDGDVRIIRRASERGKKKGD